jgi:hypothetical protein
MKTTNGCLQQMIEENEMGQETLSITELLQAWNKGDAAALEQLMPLV